MKFLKNIKETIEIIFYEIHLLNTYLKNIIKINLNNYIFLK